MSFQINACSKRKKIQTVRSLQRGSELINRYFQDVIHSKLWLKKKLSLKSAQNISKMIFFFFQDVNLYNFVTERAILAQRFPLRDTEAALWAEQCDDRAVLWEHLISSTRGAKQHHNVPWYLACALGVKIARGFTLIAKMPPEFEPPTSPVPYQETTGDCLMPDVC